jgi:hypothetical protein
VINDAILSAVNKGDKGGRRARAAIIVATAAPEGLDQAPDVLVRTAAATTAATAAAATAAGGSGSNRYGDSSEAPGGSLQGRTWTLISLKMPTAIKNVSIRSATASIVCSLYALSVLQLLPVACRKKRLLLTYSSALLPNEISTPAVCSIICLHYAHSAPYLHTV